MTCPTAWSDAHPGAAPTRAAVDALLAPYAVDRGTPVAVLAPALGEATWENIAANAAIAGCAPADLPIVIAAVRAISQPRFLLDQIVTTVHGLWPMLILSGVDAEVARDLDSLSGSAGAQARIARAVSLVLRNIAGGKPEEFDAATMGRPGKLSFGVVENTDLSPWQPWHVRAGWPAEAAVVGAYAVDSTLCVSDMGHPDPDVVLSTITDSIAIPGTYNAFFRKDLWLLMSPSHAWVFADAGWSSDDVALAIFERAVQRYDRLRGRGLFGFIDHGQRPSWITDDLADDALISVVDSPRRVHIAVVGGATGGYTTVAFGSGVTTMEEVRHDWR